MRIRIKNTIYVGDKVAFMYSVEIIFGQSTLILY